VAVTEAEFCMALANRCCWLGEGEDTGYTSRACRDICEPNTN
jgi:hypothetical protein